MAKMMAMTTERDVPVLVSDKTGAAMLGISRATFWRRVADGTFPKPIKIGGATRWRRAELLAAVEQAEAA